MKCGGKAGPCRRRGRGSGKSLTHTASEANGDMLITLLQCPGQRDSCLVVISRDS